MVAALWVLVLGALGLGVYHLSHQNTALSLTQTEAICPVTGEKLNISESTASVNYQGKVYYFAQGDAFKDAEGHEPKFRFLMEPQLYIIDTPAN